MVFLVAFFFLGFSFKKAWQVIVIVYSRRKIKKKKLLFQIKEKNYL